jgi:hypothetical protein
MSLVKCPECGSEVSDKAAVCLRCGVAIVTTAAPSAPVLVKIAPKPPSFKWWLWVPLGLGAAFLILGALIPKNVADANAAYRACAALFEAGKVGAMSECDSLQHKIRHRNDAPYIAPAVLGVDAKAINNALEDGRQKAAQPSKPVEWPKPATNLFEGQPKEQESKQLPKVRAK